MKEQEIIFNIKRIELTTKPSPSRLEEEEFYVPEQNEQSYPSINKDPQGIDSSYKTIRREEDVREAWRKNYQRQGQTLEGLTFEERQVVEEAIKMRITPVAGTAPRIDTEGITDNDLKALIENYNRHLDTTRGSVDDLNDIWKTVLSREVSPEQEKDKIEILKKIDEAIERAYSDQIVQRDLAERLRSGWYLKPKDIEELDDSPIRWLDGQFDILYAIAREGQELNSPIINRIETLIGEAIGHLQRYKSSELDKFQQLYTNRFNLMQFRTMIGYRRPEEIIQAAYRLQAHGLLIGFSMEDGKVGMMFNRLHELLEDKRLENKDHHVYPQEAYRLQDRLIEEQLALATKGIDLFGDLNGITIGDIKNIRGEKEDKLSDPLKEKKKRIENVEASIRRSVRTAYDVFVNTQRQAVIVARGKHLSGADAYFSDVTGGALNVYNLEDLLLKKFDIYNAKDEEFVRRIKLSLAEGHIDSRRKEGESLSLTEEEKEDLGRRLFRDLFAVPDFFSSGWRIKGILDALDERFIAASDFDKEVGEEKAKNFALFLRLKYAETGGAHTGDRREIWEKIANVRPEEIIRLFKERAENELDPLFASKAFTDAKIGNYNEFKNKYGGILSYIRSKYLEEPRQLDISELDKDQEFKELINQWQTGENRDRRERGEKNMETRSANKLIAMLKEMKEFAIKGGIDKKEREDYSYKIKGIKAMDELLKEELKKEKRARNHNLISEYKSDMEKLSKDLLVIESKFDDKIHLLIRDNRFEDIYTRTLLMDDALLDQLELTTFSYIDEEGKTQKTKEEKDREKILEFTPLSKRYAVDQGGDALVRIWNDTNNAVKAGQELTGFIKTEDPEKRSEHAINFAENASQYNGQLARAKIIRYTIGTLLDLQKKDYIWDVVGLHKLPFRLPMSEIEKIYGPHATPLGRDSLRSHLDRIHLLLTTNLPKDFANRTDEEKEKYKKESEKFYVELQQILEVSNKDKAKLGALRVLFYLILLTFGEGQNFIKEAVKQK